jgi:hypothetical protein
LKTKLLALLIFNFSFLIYTCDASAEIRFVSKTGSATPPYTSWATASDSIQKCIDFSVAGDTIYVANGVYKEKVIITKSLTVIGGGIDSCIIDTRELVTPTDFQSVYIGGADILFKNFYIITSTNHTGTGIRNSYTGPETIIEKNKISGAVYGIIVFNSNLTFKNNIITDVQYGVHLEAFDENYFPIIDSNIIITYSNLNLSHGISGSFGTSPTIRNNYIICEDGGYGLYLILNNKETKNNVVVKKVNSNRHGYYFSLGGGVIENNFLMGKFSNRISFWVYRGSNKVVNNNIIQGAGTGYKLELVDTIKFGYNNAWEVDNPFVGFNPDSTNLTADPMLVSEDSSDFRLQMFSPLIDAGDPTILDRDGSRSDIGVFGGPLGEKYTYMDLAPKPPKNVTAVYEDGLIKLVWDKNTEADFSFYRIYRDTVPNFIYDTTKIVGVTSNTTFGDNLPISFAKKYYYLLTAFDSTNNQSAPSEEVLVVVTELSEHPPVVVEEFKLLNNYPNPFNPSTIIPYRLKEAGYVMLKIYDIKGELIRVLVNQQQSKGYYEVEFKPTLSERERVKSTEWPTGYNRDIASGFYVYYLQVKSENSIPLFTGVGKMILLK